MSEGVGVAGVGITAVIPAYNAERHIARALQSVVAQAYAPLEVVVVDDGSVDCTAERVEQFRGLLDLRLIRWPANRGKVAALNAGIQSARHDWIAFLDADDEWLPGKLDVQVAVIRRYPDLVLVTCGGQSVDAHGIPDDADWYPDPPPHNGVDFFKSQLGRNYCATPAVVASKTHLLATGGFTEPPPCEDLDMWARLALRGRVEYVEQDLVRIYDTPGSLSKRFGVAGQLRALAVIERHVRIAGNRLSSRERRRILAARRTQTGRNVYNMGALRAGAILILRAIATGYHPRENVLFLISAHPAVAPLKRHLRRLLSWGRAEGTR